MKKIIYLLIIIILFVTIGCSGSKSMSGGQSVSRSALSVYSDTAYVYEEAEQDYGVSPNSDFNYEIERKLIKWAYIRMKVDNLEAADLMITGLINKYKGYIAITEINEYSHYYSLRVPSSGYDIFLTDAEGIGRLISRSESTEDVTIRYYDLESQLESKKELLRTFQSYLQRAGNMEEILAVEYRIAGLQREIEFTGTQLRNLTDKVDYATVDLSLQGPVLASYNEETLGERVRQLFGKFGGFLSTTAVVLLGIVIYGIPILLLFILLIWLLFGRIGLLKKLWKLVMVKTTR